MITKRKPTHPGEVIREDVINSLNLTVTGSICSLLQKIIYA